MTDRLKKDKPVTKPGPRISMVKDEIIPIDDQDPVWETNGAEEWLNSGIVVNVRRLTRTRVQQLLTKHTKVLKRGRTEVDEDALAREMISEAIVDWNIRDAVGEPIPCTPENIATVGETQLNFTKAIADVARQDSVMVDNEDVKEELEKN